MVNYDGVDGSGGVVKTCHLFDHAKKWKEEGRIKHFRFSFHSSLELLDRVLTEHPETEFVQIVVNYYDWEDDFVQARTCYEIICKHGKKVVIMEPVKGGCLAFAPKSAEALLRERDPQARIASWAMRFVLLLPDVVAILSGMSTIEQVRDNIETFEHAKPLTEDERKLLERIVRMYKKTGPFKTGDFSKYEGILRHGVSVSSILDLYNTALIQPGPDSSCHICYLKDSIAEHAHLDSFGEMPEEVAITAEGEDITALVDEAETWLVKRSCT